MCKTKYSNTRTSCLISLTVHFAQREQTVRVRFLGIDKMSNIMGLVHALCVGLLHIVDRVSTCHSSVGTHTLVTCKG